MFGLGPLEIVVIGAIAVMLYGRRLPEVGRSFGRTLGDLRKQWTTLARELDVTSQIDGRLPNRSPGRQRRRLRLGCGARAVAPVRAARRGRNRRSGRLDARVNGLASGRTVVAVSGHGEGNRGCYNSATLSGS